jgi:aldehyde:ferredoxin oxidoreductase
MTAGGYMGRYLLVDLEKKKIQEFDFSDGIKRKYLGGYGLGCKYIYENQKSGIDPLSLENIFAIMTGPIDGTTIPGGARFCVCAKSPLTGTWGDSNCGGSFGPRMKMAGFDGAFFIGKSDNPVYLLLDNGKASLEDASFIWGMDTYFSEDLLREKHGKNAEPALIGKGGEDMRFTANITNRKGKVAGRSGMGAVMGSKRLKAVVVTGSEKVTIKDKEAYDNSRKQFIEDIKNDYGDAAWLKYGGTPTVIEFGIDEQDSPIKNWSGATSDMGDYSQFNYDNVKKYIVKRETCFGCPISCWDRSMLTTGPYALKEPSHIPEYETSAMFGALCLNSNYESIIKCNDLCNRYGIDTMSTGGTIAFAIECYENGILTKKDTDGLELTWGNHEAIVALTEKIVRKEGFGDILADGSRKASQIIGKGSEEFAMQIGGRELPAHDTRWDPSLAIIYALEPTPANHCQANQNLGHKDIGEVFPDVDFSTCAGENKTKYLGRAKEIRVLSSLIHTVNCTGMCLFAWGCTDIRNHASYLSAITGWDIDVSELLKTGERIMNMRQAFNIREGFNQLEYEIPGRMLGRPPLTDGKTKGITLDWEEMIEEYYSEMDWDIQTSKPNKRKLIELDLEWLIKDIWDTK